MRVFISGIEYFGNENKLLLCYDDIIKRELFENGEYIFFYREMKQDGKMEN